MSTVRSRRRRDLILAILNDAEHPMTTNQIARAVGDSYSAVYSALRSLCGSHTLPYAECTGTVNVAGYPVIWHSWGDPDRGAYVCWELTAEERDRRAAEIAELEAGLELSGGPDG